MQKKYLEASASFTLIGGAVKIGALAVAGTTEIDWGTTIELAGCRKSPMNSDEYKVGEFTDDDDQVIDVYLEDTGRFYHIVD